MIPLPAALTRVAEALHRASGPVLATLARFVFAAVLLRYFWASAWTKVRDRSGPAPEREGQEGLFDIFTIEPGVYPQMFPRAFEAAGYDPSAMSLFHKVVAVFGTYAEFLLPLLIVLGLFTRLAALGMVGFVVVQSATDIWGHGAGAGTIGAWFDTASDALILDQRAFWILTLLVLVFRGGGPLSLDRLVFGRPAPD